MLSTGRGRKTIFGRPSRSCETAVTVARCLLRRQNVHPWRCWKKDCAIAVWFEKYPPVSATKITTSDPTDDRGQTRPLLLRLHLRPLPRVEQIKHGGDNILPKHIVERCKASINFLLPHEHAANTRSQRLHTKAHVIRSADSRGCCDVAFLHWHVLRHLPSAT